MRTIIAGSRSIQHISLVEEAVGRCGWKITTVISGTAGGADTLGEKWAERMGIPVERFPARWRVNGVYVPSAGYKRNVEMAEHADALVAIWDGVSKGTGHMINIARAKGLEVFVFRVDAQ